MAKYLVETYYTCNIKVSHYLDDISENSLKNLEKQEDGKFEILDIKLDSRKTKNLDKTDNKYHFYLLKVLKKCIIKFDNNIAKQIIRKHILDKLKDFDKKNKIIFIFLLYSIGDITEIEDIQQFIETTEGQDKHLIVEIQEKVNNSIPVNLSDLLDGIIKTYQLHT